MVDIDEAFRPFLQDLLEGREVPPVISKTKYGWLLTVYKPIRNEDGKTVAYAAADVDMDGVMIDRGIFIAKMISLIFEATLLIMAAAIEYAERKIVRPINATTTAAENLAYERDKPGNQHRSFRVPEHPFRRRNRESLSRTDKNVFRPDAVYFTDR